MKQEWPYIWHKGKGKEVSINHTSAGQSAAVRKRRIKKRVDNGKGSRQIKIIRIFAFNYAVRTIFRGAILFLQSRQRQ